MADITRYLPYISADYEGEILSINPQKTMIIEGDKNQIVHEYDDKSVSVITMSGSFFTSRTQWDLLTFEEAQTIADMFHDENKANGRARTFLMAHPRQSGVVMVCRFMSSLPGVYTGGKSRSEGIRQIDLRIEGIKQVLSWSGITWSGITWR